jgi:glyoxylase-like metal-dependent hydrolase (beta-lactamase superfamily II)
MIDIQSIKQIILTHEHYDHCGGVKKLFNIIDEKPVILAHLETTKKLKKGISLFAQMLGGKMPKISVDINLKDKEIINIGDSKFQIFFTPGHSPGSICMFDKTTKSLISGDTVFSYGSFGRYDFPGGNLNLLKKSIEKLAMLDIQNLYPGHELFIEKEGNKHMKMTLSNIRSIS